MADEFPSELEKADESQDNLAVAIDAPVGYDISAWFSGDPSEPPAESDSSLCPRSCFVSAAEPELQSVHEPAARTWNLVIIPEDDVPRLGHFSSAEELAAYLTRFFSKESPTGAQLCTFYIFAGERIHFTRGPYRYLLPTDAPPLPLFAPPNPVQAEIEESGAVRLTE